MRLMADVTDGDEDAMEIMEKKFGRLEDAWNEISKKLGTKNPEPRQIAMLMKTLQGIPRIHVRHAEKAGRQRCHSRGDRDDADGEIHDRGRAGAEEKEEKEGERI